MTFVLQCLLIVIILTVDCVMTQSTETNLTPEQQANQATLDNLTLDQRKQVVQIYFNEECANLNGDCTNAIWYALPQCHVGEIPALHQGCIYENEYHQYPKKYCKEYGGTIMCLSQEQVSYTRKTADTFNATLSLTSGSTADDQWKWLMTGNGDIYGIHLVKTIPKNATEIWKWDHADYNAPPTSIALLEDLNFKYGDAGNFDNFLSRYLMKFDFAINEEEPHDIYVIGKYGLGSKTHISIIFAGADQGYQTILPLIPTKMGPTDERHDFVKLNDATKSLCVINKVGQSGKTEMQCLQTVGLVFYQALGYNFQLPVEVSYPGQYTFLAQRGTNDMVVIKRVGTATLTTEIRLLSNSTQFQTITEDITATPLSQTPAEDNWHFPGMDKDGNLFALKMGEFDISDNKISIEMYSIKPSSTDALK